MYSMPEITPELLSRFTQIDYDREMALIAVTEIDGEIRQVGVARYYTMPDQLSCEFAIVIADAWQNRGVARRLMRALVDAARSRRFTRMIGTVLVENHRMLDFVRSLGFRAETSPEDTQLMDVTLEL
jgi:acetyltransferase